MVAALFVSDKGPYVGQPGIDARTEARDARLYNGPWPVVAHPPCERWGRYWSGGPSAKLRRKKGDDNGCFMAALANVRRWGGVLEHPAGSYAWAACGLVKPPASGGWVSAGDFIGWTCHVEQGHYGHAARKATWLYAVSRDLPVLKWGPSGAKMRLDEGWHTSDARARARCRDQANQAPHDTGSHRHAQALPRSARAARSAREVGMRPLEQLSKTARAMTPIPFRDLLIEIALASRW